jgi:hypothetical protein
VRIHSLPPAFSYTRARGREVPRDWIAGPSPLATRHRRLIR